MLKYILIAVVFLTTGCLPEIPDVPNISNAKRVVIHAEVTRFDYSRPPGEEFVQQRRRFFIIIDAVDNKQPPGHGNYVDEDTGETKPYPFEAVRETPYEHPIFYEPGLTLTIDVVIVIPEGASDRGDIVKCYLTQDGEIIEDELIEVRTKGEVRVNCFTVVS